MKDSEHPSLDLLPGLPASPHLARTDVPPPRPAPHASGRWPACLTGQADFPVRVLLVDGDAGLRRNLLQELMGDPRLCVVGEAASLAAGRRLLAQVGFDVLVLDTRLPDGSGLELIRAARDRRVPVEIIVLSAQDDDSLVRQAFALGASGYLVKNSWFRNVAQAVLQVVNGGAPLSPDLARRLLMPRRSPDDISVPPSREDRLRAPDSPLSARESQVLQLVAAGLVDPEIAARLGVSRDTVSAHVKNALRKLGVRTRAQAVHLLRC